MKPGPLKRTGPPERRAPLRRRRRAQRPTELMLEEARLQILFAVEGKRAAIPPGGTKPVCAACGYDGFFLEVHHVIEKEELKRYLSQKGRPCPVEVLWDPENALVLCQEPAPNRCHRQHTNGHRRLPRSKLRFENVQFAHRHGLAWVVEANYPEVQAA